MIKALHLKLEAKNHTIPLIINTTKETTPIGDISYLINPGNIIGKTDNNGNKTIPFHLNTNNYNEPLNTNATFDFTKTSTTKDIHYDRTILANKENNFTFDLTKQTYQHIFNVSTSSNIEGKTPLLTGSTGTITYDGKTEEFDPITGTISFVSDDEIEDNIVVNVSNVQGHNNGEIVVNNVGAALKNHGNHEMILEGIVYNATQPIIVTDGENPISGANVAYTFGEESGNKNTGTNGKTTFTFTNIETNINNLPLDEYLLNTITNKTGYPESTNSFNITSGVNEQAEISMGANQYWITGNVTPTNNVNVKGYKDGNIKFNTTVTNGTFATDTIQSATANYTLDSLVFNTDGFIPEKFINLTLNKNTVTTQNATLEEEAPTEYTYWLTGAGTPNNATIKGWKNGVAELNGTVTSGTYQTNQLVNTEETFTLDSIIFDSPGFIKQKLNNQTLTQNTGTTRNFALTEEEKSYRFVGNNSSPSGTSVEVWDDGVNIANGSVSGNSYSTNEWTSTSNTMEIDSIVFKNNGFIPEKFVNVSVNPGDNTQNADLDEIITTYTTSITGKVLDLTKERVRNRTNALVVENASGVQQYFSLDSNGEFSGDVITNSPDEQVKMYWNESTMSDFDKNTISVNKHNSTYPINRVIAGDYKPYDETSLVSVDVSKLDDDYLREYAGKDIIVNDEILKFAIKGGSQNLGSFNYGRTEPLRPYVYTLLPDGTTPISTTDQQNMELATDQARNIFYDTETGWTVPVNTRQSGTNFGARNGNWLMKQIPAQGYWNLGYMISGETNLLEGGEAQVSRPVHPETGYAEIIGPWIRDGLDGSASYCSTWNNGNPTLTNLGKAHMSITTDFPAGSGKE